MKGSLLGNPSLRGQAALGTVSALITTVLLVPIYGLTKASFGIPFFYSGDANFHGMLIKGVLDHGWYYDNPLLSAPEGQDFRDFPMPDNLHLVIIRGLDWTTDSYAVAMNLYYLGGFALTAFFTTLLLRRLRFSPIASVSIGILYALAPYHFSRNQNHLFLASYWTLPFAVYLAMGVLEHVPLFRRRPVVRGAASWFTWTTFASLAMAFLVASGSGYYGLFTVIILASASTSALVRRRPPGAALSGLVLIVVIFATIFANLSPHLLNGSGGRNDDAVVRTPGSGEYYGLKLTQLLLPMQEHRLAALGSVTERYLREFPLPSESHPLGTLAAVGLAGILCGLFLVVGRSHAHLDERLLALILFTIVAILVAIPGGFSSLLELFATPVLRGWNRLSIFIMLFGLMYLGVLFDKSYLRAGAGRRRAFLAALCALVTIFGIWDQTSNRFRPDYAGNRQEFLSDREFLGRIEAMLPASSMVFQLPAMEFPEAGPRNDMDDYDHLRGFLHSDHLRWSYGGVRGRTSADWPARLDDERPWVIVAKLASVGYRGIYIDRYGYADRAARLEAELSKLVGAEPIVSRNSRLSFFDIRVPGRMILESISNPQVQALRRATLEPIELDWGERVHGEEHDGNRSWRWMTDSAAVVAEVPGGEERQVIVTFGAAAPSSEGATLRIDASGHAPRVLTIGSGIEDHSIELRLQPGANNIVFRTDAPAIRPPGEKRDLRVQLFDLRVDDAEAVSVLRRLDLAA